MDDLRALAHPAMGALAQALLDGRLSPPYGRHAIRTLVPDSAAAGVKGVLRELDEDGMAPRHIGLMLKNMAAERASAQAVSDRLDLVWSGIESGGATVKDTAHVARELFRQVRRSVLIATYAIDKGEKAKALFGELATRMDDEPDLVVRLFLNVHRPHNDAKPESVLLREFASTFRADIWPGDRLPEVFHDPRSTAQTHGPRACLHAKCVVIDNEQALVTSANFTEAAHERNIEAGILIRDRLVAGRLIERFMSLVERGELLRVPGT